MCNAHGGLGSQPSCPRIHGGIEFIVGHDTIEHPVALGRCGVEAVAERNQLLRPGYTDFTCEPGCGAPRERDAEVHLGNVEDRAGGSDAQIARESEHEAAADSVAVQACDGDCLDAFDGIDRAPPNLCGVAAFAAPAPDALAIRAGGSFRSAPAQKAAPRPPRMKRRSCRSAAAIR